MKSQIQGGIYSVKHQVLIPILLLNMLIAMMGNTYGIVIESAEKEFLKAWAKVTTNLNFFVCEKSKSKCVQVIMSLERSVTEAQAKEYIESYSIGLGPTERWQIVLI